jgi:ABC-type phosphate transport system substrate-binding protein
MLRKFYLRRGIVLVVPAAFMALAACTPPMPPDVLAARAEASVVCQEGTLDVAVPTEFANTMATVGDALQTVCPQQVTQEVAVGSAASAELTGHAPTVAEIAAFDSANCPDGDVISVPAFAYPVTIAYNVLGLEGVVLSPKAIAGILNGTITQWSDPAIVEENPDFGFEGLPAIALYSSEKPQGAMEAMTAWLVHQGIKSWTQGVTGTITAGAKAKDPFDLIAKLNSTEGALAVIPIFEATSMNLPMANLPVTFTNDAGETQNIIVTTDDVQLYKVGSGATVITEDPKRGLLASPAVGGKPVEGNFDLASSKIVLGEGQPLIGWPVEGYAHLMICDSKSNPMPLAFAQYMVRLAGQGSLEAFGVTPMPEPLRIRTFVPLKVVVNAE